MSWVIRRVVSFHLWLSLFWCWSFCCVTCGCWYWIVRVRWRSWVCRFWLMFLLFCFFIRLFLTSNFIYAFSAIVFSLCTHLNPMFQEKYHLYLCYSVGFLLHVFVNCLRVRLVSYPRWYSCWYYIVLCSAPATDSGFSVERSDAGAGPESGALLAEEPFCWVEYMILKLTFLEVLSYLPEIIAKHTLETP